jgi:hypothetical protein
MASRDACAAGFTGRLDALGPSPRPVGPWQAAHHLAYSAGPSDPLLASGAGRLAGAAPSALPGWLARYLVISARVDGGIAVRGIAEPGTTRCGSAIIAAMYAGERRSLTVVRSGPIVPPSPRSR